MTWVIVRHWTRKFLIVAISSDYFKHVRIWQTRSSEKTEIQVLTTGRLSSLRNLDKYTSPPLLPEPQRCVSEYFQRLSF
ncbi:uncharacterized protein OCT59_027352 [Rhizophagus irregularis]|uniref:Uncharacterized protein n=1 Tax=Rhizophagus irregularis TaxID=588596 RepID=A0A915Z172_9GLOM|nr:hypothetical protein OCT59_027352 [Rhizophagus irregularis]CAB4478413.1 unnamed protein product [Rhizophagus irregularis]CAB5357555.1 unnamed protein product [Rhizophagus irregularis]